jgi:hypothetical protein
MAITRVELTPVEGHLVDAATSDRNRAVEIADAAVHRRLTSVKRAHGIEDGERVEFKPDQGRWIMEVGHADPPKDPKEETGT